VVKIAVGGFQHETNTFTPKKSTYEDFVEADGWPGLTRGDDLISTLKGYNIGVTGLLEGVGELGWDIAPMSWCYGGAGGTVTKEAFEKISALILEDLQNTVPIDGLLLDLHGAMVTEHFEDGEGEFLRRVRAQVGPDLPIVACLDLHANLTAEMVALTDRLIVYRTYPHLDMAETGRRAAHHLAEVLGRRRLEHKSFRQLPFLIPNTVGCTMIDPTKGVYARLAELERQPGISHMSMACGFCPSDVPHCGPGIIAYGPDETRVEAAVDDLYFYITQREAEFMPGLWNVEDAVHHAVSTNVEGGPPVILADVQDNYGGGTDSDTNWILAELIRQEATEAVVGVLCDPEVVVAAHNAGTGANITVGLGGKSGLPGHAPYFADYHVEALGDGNIRSTGVYFAGGMMRLGPMALLRIGGVRVVVSTYAEQAADQAMFTHLKIEPAKQSILVLKSSVHYRADFQPIAAEILEVVAPASVVADNRDLEFKNLRPGLRIMPSGQAFATSDIKP
jgi:microcystin degradation protein MlrC